jgi:hypothetical protein
MQLLAPGGRQNCLELQAVFVIPENPLNVQHEVVAEHAEGTSNGPAESEVVSGEKLANGILRLGPSVRGLASHMHLPKPVTLVYSLSGQSLAEGKSFGKMV